MCVCTHAHLHTGAHRGTCVRGLRRTCATMLGLFTNVATVSYCVIFSAVVRLASELSVACCLCAWNFFNINRSVRLAHEFLVNFLQFYSIWCVHVLASCWNSFGSVCWLGPAVFCSLSGANNRVWFLHMQSPIFEWKLVPSSDSYILIFSLFFLF